jgi:hypothetical protein
VRPIIFVNIRGLLISPLAGNWKSNLIPANLIKAAIDPVNVTPPIKVPKNEATACKLEGWRSIMKEAILVVTYINKNKIICDNYSGKTNKGMESSNCLR